jgi:hypothetical protein
VNFEHTFENFRSDIMCSRKVADAAPPVRPNATCYYLTTRTSFDSGFAPGCVNYKKRCTRLAAASNKVYQLLAHGGWFCPGTPASSTTKADRHDIAEILPEGGIS